MPISIVRDDLTNMKADAIVLPSNERLRVDGGSGGAVAKKAGPLRVRNACRKLGGCPVGSAVVTPAFSFPAKHLIHAVGPVWNGGADDARLLRSAYDAALNLAGELQCRSVALPLLSAGTFGCPAHISLSTALSSIETFLETADIDVTLVLFDKRAVSAGLDFLGELESRIDDAYVETHRTKYIPDDYDELGSLEGSVEYGHTQCYAASSEARSAPMSSSMRSSRRGKKRHSKGSSSDHALNFDPYTGAPLDEFRDISNEDLLRQPSAGPHAMCETAVEDEAAATSVAYDGGTSTEALEGILEHMDDGFSQTLLGLIDKSGMTDAQVYRRANMTRQHFSKIRSNAGYRPSKATVLALCVALELDVAQTRDLLSRAGFALSHASKFDIILEYFIERGIYDQFKINETLFYFDQPLLGG